VGVDSPQAAHQMTRKQILAQYPGAFIVAHKVNNAWIFLRKGDTFAFSHGHGWEGVPSVILKDHMEIPRDPAKNWAQNYMTWFIERTEYPQGIFTGAYQILEKVQGHLASLRRYNPQYSNPEVTFFRKCEKYLLKYLKGVGMHCAPVQHTSEAP
jgi:hypothetical protein